MLDRRDVLRLLTTGAAWPLADHLLSPDLLAFGQDVHASAAADLGTFRAFDAQAARTVTAACDRIIPADDTPGAVAAGVPAFIDCMLADWHDDADRARFLAGLDTLDTRSRAANGRPFADCAEPEQVALLTALDAEVQRLTADARRSHWFGMLKYLTIWGYCTSEVGMRQELRTYPQPTRYDGNAPYVRRRS